VAACFIRPILLLSRDISADIYRSVLVTIAPASVAAAAAAPAIQHVAARVPYRSTHFDSLLSPSAGIYYTLPAQMLPSLRCADLENSTPSSSAILFNCRHGRTYASICIAWLTAKPQMRSVMDHTVLPANYTMPAFTPSRRTSPPFDWYSFYRPTEAESTWVVGYIPK